MIFADGTEILPKNDNDLFYTCSLIEFIGREVKQKRVDLVNFLGKQKIKHIYNIADVLHCEQIKYVAQDYIKEWNIPCGTFDNVKDCKYEVPSYWNIGNNYSRLIEDITEPETSLIYSNENNQWANKVIESLFKVYNSLIDKAMSNFNSDFFYQQRAYIYLCYQCKNIIDD